MKKPNLRVLAAKAGVSINTASRAINDKPDINPLTKEKILRIAREIGYVPNASAVALRTQKTKTLGVIIADNNNPFYAEVLSGIEAEAKANNYHIILTNTRRDYQEEENAIELLLGKQVDGLLIAPVQEKNEDIYKLIDSKIPFVVVGRDYEDLSIDAVYSDELKGGYIATEYLIKKGFKNISYIGGYTYKSPARRRLEGYKKALTDYGIPIKENLIKIGDIDIKDGYNQTKDMFDQGINFQAIFAYNDMMAFGAVKAIKERGLEIPGDIGVVGYDNILFSSLVSPPLTTVNLKKDELGRESVRLLLSKINGHRKKNKKIVLDVDLLIRGT
ncbi:MAG: LacI family DNA-binding transcriptional regulator [Atribacterota bacterium]|nr:LacI family DNA-binding transcriptional regulator [Atribacterota bacterium]